MDKGAQKTNDSKEELVNQYLDRYDPYKSNVQDAEARQMAAELIERGHQARESGRYAEAERYYATSNNIIPNPEAEQSAKEIAKVREYARKGTEEGRSKKFQSAHENFVKALELDPRSPTLPHWVIASEIESKKLPPPPVQPDPPNPEFAARHMRWDLPELTRQAVADVARSYMDAGVSPDRAVEAASRRVRDTIRAAPIVPKYTYDELPFVEGTTIAPIKKSLQAALPSAGPGPGKSDHIPDAIDRIKPLDDIGAWEYKPNKLPISKNREHLTDEEAKREIDWMVAKSNAELGLKYLEGGPRGDDRDPVKAFQLLAHSNRLMPNRVVAESAERAKKMMPNAAHNPPSYPYAHVSPEDTRVFPDRGASDGFLMNNTERLIIGEPTKPSFSELISDEGTKVPTKVSSNAMSPDDARMVSDDFLQNLASSQSLYKYKDAKWDTDPGDPGRPHLGIMAQDVAKSHIGSAIVKDMNGTKVISQPAALSAALAGLGRLHERMSTLEKKKR